jgi:hypothetical protein
MKSLIKTFRYLIAMILMIAGIPLILVTLLLMIPLFLYLMIFDMIIPGENTVTKTFNIFKKGLK